MARKAKTEESPIWLELQKRVPRGEGAKGTRHWISNEDRLYVLWWWSKGWTLTRTAEGVPCSPMTVRNIRVEFMRNPHLIFKLPVLLQVGPRAYQCQFCTEIRPTRTKCMRHILAHFLPLEWAKTAPVEEIEFL